MAASKLYMEGHVWVDQGPYPCPQAGWEDCIVATDLNGVPAYWTDGHIYILDESQSKNDPTYTKWASK